MKHRGMLHRLIDMFMGVAQDLKVQCSCNDAEYMALLVYRIMSFKSRQFHTLEHIFSFCENTDPHTTLSAIFHDLVYYQVDDGFQADLADIALSYVEIVPEGVQIRNNTHEKNEFSSIALALFGFKPGQILTPSTGLNEFLSALVFIDLFRKHLPRLSVIAVLVCIEGSIPFRKIGADGLDPFERIYKNLLSFVSPEAADTMVRRSIQFANQDVVDFSLKDPGHFLNGTWKLLPELNSALRQSGCYTINQYRLALGKMRGFFGFIDPDWIFHSFRGTPDDKTMTELKAMAHHNVLVAHSYLDAKLLAIALIEAIAMNTGGDAPVALFIGDIPRNNDEYEHLTDHLVWPEAVADLRDHGTSIPKTQSDKITVITRRLLKHGRLDDSSFDLKNSPLGLYLYETIPHDALMKLVQNSKDYFKGNLDGISFLRSWDRPWLSSVIKACVAMVPTRREALEALDAKLLETQT